MTGSVHETRIPRPDGGFLAATLYLPHGAGPESPAPVLLEALPYRKDDLTSGYRPEYVRFRDEHGYAVVRVDLRGTGSSVGVATDEYPPQEQADLVVAIAWVAEQDWCNGAVGMFGTSWSGFNSLQVAMARPPALRAICASYASDDRWTDDVHYYGGSLRLLDQVDYPLYMLAMNALPPVPAVFGPGWRDEWLRRIADTPPWQLTWLREQNRDPYWRQGSLRPDYGRIQAATMLIVGWADGYRNNSLRTARALRAAGVPVHVLAGPWSHQAPATARPGPNVDHVPLMARWFDRFLRDGVDEARDGRPGSADAPGDDDLALFVRRFAPPAAAAAHWAGEWWADTVRGLDERTRFDVSALGTVGDVREVRTDPDLGLAAWNSCAGALPWGQPTDQRFDDARALCVDRPVTAPTAVVGNPVVRLRLRPEVARAAVAVRLCAVAPDGTSLLVSRGLVNLSYRNGLTGAAPLTPSPVVPGEWYDVDVELETCSYEFGDAETLRIAIATTEWPNAVAPPDPHGFTVDLGASSVTLPVVSGPPEAPPPVLPVPPVDASADEPTDPGPDVDSSDVRWWTTHDVLDDRIGAHVDHGSSYAAPYGARCRERYTGSVEVSRRDWRQRAVAATSFEVTWPEATVTAESRLELLADSEAFDVTLTLAVTADGESVADRRWHERIPRDLG
ncbi:MAG: CocE/NonD family hydrolase [Candidatus Nanopelagicales bacterium]